jgi:hypothetical protein
MWADGFDRSNCCVLSVRTSLIPNSGDGLFAGQHIKKGQTVC